jgi:hypothetical protein
MPHVHNLPLRRMSPCGISQVIGVRAPTAGAAAPQMGGHETIILENCDRQIRGTQPQRLADQGERRGVQAVVELYVAVTVQDQSMPGAQIRCHRRQRVHQRLLDRKQIEGSLTRGAVNANAGFLGDPPTSPGVQIRQVYVLGRGNFFARSTATFSTAASAPSALPLSHVSCSRACRPGWIRLRKFCASCACFLVLSEMSLQT